MHRGLLWLGLALLAVAGVSAHDPDVDYTVHSAMLATDATFEHAFAEPGDYTFHCHPHPWMTGILHVVDDDVAPVNASFEMSDAGADGGDGKMGFASLDTGQPFATVRTGGNVTWTNHGTLSHNVMAGKMKGASSAAPGPTAALAAIGVLVVAATQRRGGCP